MDGRSWLWALSVAAQLAVCGFLFYNGHFRKLPLFATYIVLNICQAGFLAPIYAIYGANSPQALLCYWSTQAITMVARVLATVEILHAVLGAYRGIWALGWRLLTAIFAAVLSYTCYSFLHSDRIASQTVALADLGFNVAFAIALVACLVLVRYYSVPVAPVPKVLLAGLCFFACAAILQNSALLDGIVRHFHYRTSQNQAIWDAASLLPFMFVQVVWAVTLRRPSEASGEEPSLLPPSVYGEFSSQVNDRLRALNDHLSEFWKVGRRRP